MANTDSFLLLLHRAGGGGGVKFRAWHGRTRGSHEQERDRYRARGYSFLSLSLHGTVSAPRYSAVMIERDFPPEQRDWSALTSAEFQHVFEDQALQGFGPVLIGATGSFADARFAAVFEPQSPIALTRHRLRSGSADDEGTIQGMNARAKNDGLVLRWAAAYGNSLDEGFAAIWTPNTGNVIWNADGILETHAQYQSRFDAQVSGWCRPAFVTLNEQQRYLSLFVENEVGAWVARHGMTGSSYQAEFNEQVARGYFPTCVQGSGAGSATRYAALFAKRVELLPNQFTATGPVSHNVIDDVILDAMSDSPVWNASLAIVRGKELVYAKGYSYGEPDWPLAQPSTRFRIASVSKLIGALATYQLHESNSIGPDGLDTSLQDILQLQTPDGAAPTDPRFGDITVRHLLEHTSGLSPQAFWQDISIRDAFRAARPGETWTLPVTAEMADAYIASLDLLSDPGQEMAYNNCGYYLLGRFVARVRGRASAFDALQDFLFLPLDMTRSRPAPSLISTMPWNEARYRAGDIQIGRSVMSEDRPLVPLSYGTRNLEKIGCAGGLSMAATDLGRIIAVLLSDNDTPALSRTTVTQMMDNAIANRQNWQGNTLDLRAGHGWDAANTRTGGRYYAQKGGSLATSGNVLQIDGEWGFAMCWGGRATAAGGWYPNYPAVMDVAKAIPWSRDLFPELGMAPLP